MAAKMSDPIVSAGGSPQEILSALKRLADYVLSKEEEYVCTKILYKLTKFASLTDFLAACSDHSSIGVTRKQVEVINPFVKVLSQFVW